MGVNGLLLALILVTPLIAGLFSLFLKTPRYALIMLGSVCFINISFMAAGLIFISLPLEVHLSNPLSFIISRNALLVNLSVYIAGGFMLFIGTRKKTDSLSKIMIVCSTLGLSLSSVAFFAGNFLLRYIALELLGLILAVVILSGKELWVNFQLASKIFITLKFGDLGMLIGILIMSSFTGTLDIQAAIEGSKGLPFHMLSWSLSGFILAGLVKMGAWPFYFWIERGKETVPKGLHWLFDVMVPSLGMYLLYRITPLISIYPAINSVIFYAATAFLLILAVISGLKVRKYLPGMIMNTTLAASAVLLTATGSSDAVLRLILINVLIRMLCYITPLVKKYQLVINTVLSLLIGSLLILNVWPLHGSLAANQFVIVLAAMVLTMLLLIHRTILSGGRKVSGIDTSQKDVKVYLSAISGWIFMYVERGFFHNGIEALTRFVIRVVSWIYGFFEIRLVELVTLFFQRFIQGFQRVNETAEDGVKHIFVQKGQSFVRFVSTFFETYGIDKGSTILGKSILKGGEGVKEIEERSFRKNLLWIPLMLLFLILFLILMPLLGSMIS